MTKVSLRWSDEFLMYGIASSFWTSDDRLRKGQQPGADLQFGVLRRSQIDFAADLVVLPKEANHSPLLHKMFKLPHGQHRPGFEVCQRRRADLSYRQGLAKPDSPESLAPL